MTSKHPRTDAMFEAWNEYTIDYDGPAPQSPKELCIELEADLAHAIGNHAHLVQVNAMLRQRPDLPVDRIPAIEAFEKRIRDLTMSRDFFEGLAMGHEFRADKAEAQVKRVQELHTGLMKAADERLDFVMEELRAAKLEIEVRNAALSQAVDFWNPAQDLPHPLKFTAFVKYVEALIRPKETEFFATAPKPEESNE